MGVCDSDSVIRTSAGSRNMAEMRMRKEKSVTDISATGHQIDLMGRPTHFLFCFNLRVGIFASEDRMDLLPV